MDMIDVVRYYRYRVDVEKDAYGCLLFALQLPSICSRIKKNAGFTEYAELKNDGGENTPNGYANIEIHLVGILKRFHIMMKCGRSFVKVFIT